MSVNPANSVEAYIKNFDQDLQERLRQIRSIIQNSVPGVVESISYGMPAYKTYGKPLVYFAGYKGHLGFYATPTGHKAFQKELSKFKQGKGSVQFPNNEPLPVDLIQRIVEFRKEENQRKFEKK